MRLRPNAFLFGLGVLLVLGLLASAYLVPGRQPLPVTPVSGPPSLAATPQSRLEYATYVTPRNTGVDKASGRLYVDLQGERHFIRVDKYDTSDPTAVLVPVK